MPETGNHSFPRTERLKSTKIIERLFLEGRKVKAFPMVVRYMDTPLPEAVPCQAMVSVSKRAFKRAVDRNRIKRLMREAWRLQKKPLLEAWSTDETQKALVFIFVGKEMPTFESIQRGMATAIEKLSVEGTPTPPNTHS